MVAPKGCRIKSQKGIIVFRCDRIASHRAGYLVACAEECSRHLAPDAKASYRIAPYSLAVQGAPRVYPMFSSIFSPTVPGRPEHLENRPFSLAVLGASGLPGTVQKNLQESTTFRDCRMCKVHAVWASRKVNRGLFTIPGQFPRWVTLLACLEAAQCMIPRRGIRAA